MHLPFLPQARTTKKPPPKWDPFTPAFTRLSRSATTHPVQTMVIVALLASTTYIQMLEHSLFDRNSSLWGHGISKRAELLDGSVTVAVGQETDWKWKETAAAADEFAGAKHIAVVSLSFPPLSLATSTPILPSSVSATELESKDPSTKIYAVPFEELGIFINQVKTLPSNSDTTDEDERKQWVMQAGRGSRASHGGIIARTEEAARNIWDLIQVRKHICTTLH